MKQSFEDCKLSGRQKDVWKSLMEEKHVAEQEIKF